VAGAVLPQPPQYIFIARCFIKYRDYLWSVFYSVKTRLNKQRGRGSGGQMESGRLQRKTGKKRVKKLNLKYNEKTI
jgi:hypothetical protein